VVKLGLGSLRCDAFLFGESQSRIILSMRPDAVESLLSRAEAAGIPAAQIGTVGGNRLVIDVEKGGLTGGCRIDLPIDQVSGRWARALEDQLNQE
jgi:phosphoribosylformylglycinamidine synthase